MNRKQGLLDDNPMKLKNALLASAAALLALSAPAQAAFLLGTAATASMSNNPGNNDVAELRDPPDYADRTATVVDPGPAINAFVGEFFIYDNFGPYLSVDIKDDRIHFSIVNSRTFGSGNLLTLGFAGLSDDIGGISFENILGVGFLAPDLAPWPGIGSFTSNSITIDLSNTVFSAGTGSSFNVVVSSVPEPSSLALAGAGLAVLGASAARRRRKQ